MSHIFFCYHQNVIFFVNILFILSVEYCFIDGGVMFMLLLSIDNLKLIKPFFYYYQNVVFNSSSHFYGGIHRVRRKHVSEVRKHWHHLRLKTDCPVIRRTREAAGFDRDGTWSLQGCPLVKLCTPLSFNRVYLNLTYNLTNIISCFVFQRTLRH